MRGWSSTAQTAIGACTRSTSAVSRWSAPTSTSSRPASRRANLPTTPPGATGSSHFDSREQNRPGDQKGEGHAYQHDDVQADAEMRGGAEKRAQDVDPVRQRVDRGDDGQRLRESFQRKDGARKEKERHDQEVHDQLESLEVLDHRGDRGAERREQQRDEQHHGNGQRQQREVRPESEDQRQQKNDDSLNRGHRRAAERAAEHDGEARHRSDEHLLEESELPVPNDLHAGKDGGEQDAHGHDAGGEKLKVVAAAGAPVDGAEAEAQSHEKEQRLSQRAD